MQLTGQATLAGMFTPASSAAFTSLATGFTLSATLIIAIGAQNTFVLRQGLRREHVAAVVLVCALLDLLLMAAGVAGLGAAIGDRPALLRAVALAGAAALVWYAGAAFRRAWHPQTLQAATGGVAQPLGRVVLQTLTISLLNPHVYLDTVVLVGAVGARQPAGTQGVFLAGAALASALWFITLGFGARLLSPLFARPAAWRVLDVVVGLSMAALALRLLAALA